MYETIATIIEVQRTTQYNDDLIYWYSCLHIQDIKSNMCFEIMN